MTKIKLIKQTFLPLVLAASMMLSPTASQVAYAAEDNSIQEDNRIFIPFRNEIPAYLSMNSSFKSDVVTSLWKKIFYEEATWNPAANENKSSWVAKYNDYFLGLGGESKLLSKATQNQKITYSTGDFEAFFANTLEANPDFLGELLGITGDASSSSGKIYQSVICTYLSNPETYSNYFAPTIIRLTSDGKYLGAYAESKDNQLRRITNASTGITLDYYMLNTLAPYYKKQDTKGNNYLSTKQTKWLESYLIVLYKDFAMNGGKSLAAKYPAIKDLIARSIYAANNKYALGQYFFNYVVASGYGAGAWLNLNDNINIPGLDDVGNIALLFNLSSGWCAGLHYDSCTDSSRCDTYGTVTDRLAVQLHKNTAATKYILGNPVTAAAYGQNDTQGWRAKYKLKHSPGASLDSYKTAVVAARFDPDLNRTSYLRSRGHESISHDAAYAKSHTETGSAVGHSEDDGEGWHMVGTAAYGTTTVYLNKIPTTAKSIVIQMHYSGHSIPNHVSEFGIEDKSYHVYANGQEITTFVQKTESGNFDKDITLDLTKLTLSQRQNGVVTFSNYCTSYGDANNGARTTTAGAKATIECNAKVIATCSRPQCESIGHRWTGTPDWANSNFKTVRINYQCTEDASHTSYEIAQIEKRIEGNFYVYTAKSSGVINPNTGQLYSYSHRVLIGNSPGHNKETIKLISNQNTSGNISNQNVSDNWVFPSGSISKSTYKSSSTTIEFSIKAGVIKTGATNLTFDVSASDKLEEFSAKLMSASGKCLSQNDFAVAYNKIYIHGVSDTDLQNCYVIITGKAYTQNWVHNYSRTPPPDAVAKISVNSVTINYD